MVWGTSCIGLKQETAATVKCMNAKALSCSQVTGSEHCYLGLNLCIISFPVSPEFWNKRHMM